MLAREMSTEQKEQVPVKAEMDGSESQTSQSVTNVELGEKKETNEAVQDSKMDGSDGGDRDLRRSRISFSRKQLHELEMAFEKDHMPTVSDRQVLASKFGLSEKSVRHWFQNRRQKMREIQRKMKSLECTPILMAVRFPLRKEKLTPCGVVITRLAKAVVTAHLST